MWILKFKHPLCWNRSAHRTSRSWITRKWSVGIKRLNPIVAVRIIRIDRWLRNGYGSWNYIHLKRCTCAFVNLIWMMVPDMIRNHPYQRLTCEEFLLSRSIEKLAKG